jgi:dihydroorotase
MNGWETCFSAIVGSVGYSDELVTKLTTNPRMISKMSIPEIKEGSAACLTLFDPEAEVEYTAEMLKSLSKNSAFLNKSLRGKVIGTISNHKINLLP